MIEHPALLFAVLFLLIALTRFLEDRFTAVQKITSAGLCTLIGIALANAGLLPHESPVYDGIFDYGVAYAIVLMILCSRLGELRRAGKPLLVTYALAVVGSFVGGVVSSLLFHSWIGPETWKLGGTFAGAFIGGGMNFVAVGQGLEVSPPLLAGAAVADNLSTVPWMVAQIILAGRLLKYYRAPEPTAPVTGPSEDPRKYWTSASVDITDLAILATLPLATLWVSSTFIAPRFPDVPEVVWLTTIALLVAQLPFVRTLRGAAVLAYFALHLFFIVIGAVSQLSEVVKAGASVFAFMILIMLIHAIVVYGVGWLLSSSLPSVTIASQAAIGGPDSALAIAMAMKWKNLVTPGIIVGIFGYAVGNYAGFACAYLLRAMLV